ncbi:MAG: hypothetical protein LW806_10665, partial [Planctomycetaceae bacterium]|nr:hypothetical protein [Planctomycetaceae bacterium]
MRAASSASKYRSRDWPVRERTSAGFSTLSGPPVQAASSMLPAIAERRSVEGSPPRRLAEVVEDGRWGTTFGMKEVLAVR